MAYFKRDRFSGIAPGIAPRLLAEQFGQTAQNIDFESGRLQPLEADGTQVGSLQTGARRSIFFYDTTGTDVWLEWNEDYVKAVPGPIPNDSTARLYWTGDGDYPKMGTYASIVSGNSGYPNVSYRLGVPAPTDAPIISQIYGTIDETITPDEVSYVYTFVTALGEEGPPSPPTTPVQATIGSNQSIGLSLTSSGSSGNYNFGSGALKRLYKSNTGSTSTQFQFVRDIPINESIALDFRPSSQLGELLPSGDWIGPPDDDTSLYPDGPLQGLIPVANGVFAGFSGKRFCLSEPYLPHAWPVAYRITLEESIVAIGTTSNGVVCLTNGKPYFVTGVDPSAMSPIQVDLAQACINKHSVVDMGDYLLYAGPDGLCAVTGAEGSVVTKGLISPKQWNSDFYPSSIRAFAHEGTYVAFWEGESNERGGWVYDPRAGEAALSTITTTEEVRGGYKNAKNGQLYLIKAADIIPYRGGNTNRRCVWKSKKFVTPKPVSMGWVHIEADSYPTTDQNRVRVWADNVLVADYEISYSLANSGYIQQTSVPPNIANGVLREPVMRLPAVLAKEWEVEVSSVVPVNAVCLSQSADEIQQI